MFDQKWHNLFSPTGPYSDPQVRDDEEVKLLTGEWGVGYQNQNGNTNIGIWGDGALAQGQLSAGLNGFLGQGSLTLGSGDAGLGFQHASGGINAGVWADVAGADLNVQTRFGSPDGGVTFGGDAQALTGSAFVGEHNGSFGAGVNLAWVSVQGDVGVNVAGVHVGVNVGLEDGLGLGFEIGPHTEVQIGPFSLGFDFGNGW